MDSRLASIRNSGPFSNKRWLRWYRNHSRPSRFNHTFIALIPKSENARSIDGFRPISLCHSIYKIISKVAANRLKLVLSSLISDEQKAFKNKRQLIDGPILIHKLLHSLQSSGRKGLLIKLDMKKPFDRINWSFLLGIMKKFGFEDQWINWIAALIKNPSFSVLINGSAQGYFRSSHGLQQGDPLSPYLFILVAEALGRGLKHLQSTGHIKGLQINQLVPPVTNSQFADDTLLAAYPSIQEIHMIKNLLHTYELTTHLRIGFGASDKLCQIKALWG